MFGYIRTAKPELKIKEYEIYKAVYCSLCRKLGKKYGFFTRFLLNYDFTFLALLSLSLEDGCEEFEHKKCVCNPVKKCNYLKNSAKFDLSSAAVVIMAYYKIKDNTADEKGFKKILNIFLKFFFSGAHKKAANDYPQIEKTVSEYIAAQSELEKQECRELDAAAEPTAKALSIILASISDDEKQKRILKRLGYCLGRYIYILDAACDIEKDKKTNSYNVFIYGAQGNLREYAVSRAKGQLYFCINEAGRAYELLDVKKYGSIISNIIYLGLEETFKKELNL